jgi:hypothetical protein
MVLMIWHRGSTMAVVCDISVVVIAFKTCARDTPAELGRHGSGTISAEHWEAGVMMVLVTDVAI